MKPKGLPAANVLDVPARRSGVRSGGCAVEELHLFREGASVAGIIGGDHLVVTLPRREWKQVKESLEGLVGHIRWAKVSLGRPMYKLRLPGSTEAEQQTGYPVD